MEVLKVTVEVTVAPAASVNVFALTVAVNPAVPAVSVCSATVPEYPPIGTTLVTIEAFPSKPAVTAPVDPSNQKSDASAVTAQAAVGSGGCTQVEF